MDMIDWGAVSAVAACVTVIVALLVLYRQNKAAKELACLQLFLQVSALYDSTEMNSRRARLAAHLLIDPESTEVDDNLLVFFENVALMLRRKLLNEELTYNLFAFDVISYWGALKHYVDDARKVFNDNTLYEQFEWLEKEMRRLEGLHGADSSTVGRDQSSIINFLRMERLRGTP